MARIADTLTEAGHNVTFLVPVVDEAKRNQLGVKITKDVVMVERSETMKKEVKPLDDNVEQYWKAEIHSGNVGTLFTDFANSMLQSCESFLKRKDIFDEMKTRNFDVGIFEPLTVCGLGFMYGLEIKKTIIASSTVFVDPVLDFIGEPLDYSHVPGLLARFDGSMDLMDRVENYKLSMAYKEWTWNIFDDESRMHKKYLEGDIPDWRDLISTCSLHFTNSLPYVDFPRLATQKTIPIGGIQVDYHAIKSEQLPDLWDGVLDERPKNMLISFGSAMRSMDLPKEWRSGLLSAIKSQPNVTFIWKYEDVDVSWASTASNIHFSKWVPQTALLNDPRLTAFMTHGGLGSTNELAHLGKPAIMVPVAADQSRNSMMLERHGGVIVFRKQDLEDSDKIKNAIKSILNDEKFKKSSEDLAEMLQNQPLKPKEQVVRHVEFVARFGPFSMMNIGGSDLGFIKKNLLDIYFVIAAPYLSVGLIAIGLVVLLVRCNSEKMKTE